MAAPAAGRHAWHEEDDADAEPAKPPVSRTEQMLVAQFGPTLTYADLASVLKRREGGLRQTLYVCRSPWCHRLIACRIKIGRRSVFTAQLIAAFLDEMAGTTLEDVL